MVAQGADNFKSGDGKFTRFRNKEPLRLTQLGLELSKRHRARIQTLKVTCSRHEPSGLYWLIESLELKMIIKILDFMLGSSENY